MEFSDAVVQRFNQYIGSCHLYPNVVPASEQLPFAHYSEVTRPIVTKNGIAGYDSTVIITVAASTKSDAQSLASQVETIFHGENVGDRTMWFDTAEYTLYEKERIHTYELTFNLT